MKGRSLWSVLMVAWLSAAGAPPLPNGPASAALTVSGQEGGSESAGLAEADAPAAALSAPEDASDEPSPQLSP